MKLLRQLSSVRANFKILESSLSQFIWFGQRYIQWLILILISSPYIFGIYYVLICYFLNYYIIWDHWIRSSFSLYSAYWTFICIILLRADLSNIICRVSILCNQWWTCWPVMISLYSYLFLEFSNYSICIIDYYLILIINSTCIRGKIFGSFLFF